MTSIKKKTLSILLILSLLVGIVGVINVDTTYAASKKIHLKKNTINLVVGKKYQQKLLGTNGKAIKAKDVWWDDYYSNGNAIINYKGIVTAKKIGKSEMSAYYKGKWYYFTVYVGPKKTHIMAKKINIHLGQTFKQELIDNKGKTIKASKVKWKSTTPKIAKINKKGIITAKRAGTAKFTAKYKGKTYKFSARVLKKMTTDKKNLIFTDLKSQTLTIKNIPSDYVLTNEYVWEKNYPTSMTGTRISPVELKLSSLKRKNKTDYTCNVTPRSNGTFTLVLTNPETRAQCKVNVKVNVKLDLGSITIKVGETKRIPLPKGIYFDDYKYANGDQDCLDVENVLWNDDFITVRGYNPGVQKLLIKVNGDRFVYPEYIPLTVIVGDYDATTSGVQDLYNFIDTNGYTNGNGDKTLKVEMSNIGTTYFINHSESVELVYYSVMDISGNKTTYLVNMTLSLPSSQTTTSQVQIDFGGKADLSAHATVPIATYTNKTNLNYTKDSGSLPSAIDIQDICNDTFSLAMSAWEYALSLKTGTAIDLNSLGFINY